MVFLVVCKSETRKKTGHDDIPPNKKPKKHTHTNKNCPKQKRLPQAETTAPSAQKHPQSRFVRIGSRLANLRGGHLEPQHWTDAASAGVPIPWIESSPKNMACHKRDVGYRDLNGPKCSHHWSISKMFTPLQLVTINGDLNSINDPKKNHPTPIPYLKRVRMVNRRNSSRPWL